MRYIGSTFGDNANTLHVPGYTLFDAALRYRAGQPAGGRQRLEPVRQGLLSPTCYENGGCIYGEGRNIKGMLTAKF